MTAQTVTLQTACVDVDNSLKALLDAMQAGGAYDDGSQITRLTVVKVKPERDAFRSEIVVRHVPSKLGEPVYHICLRCDQEFDSLGPGNRLCRECTSWKNSLGGFVRVIRGVKRHNGEV